MSSVFRQRRERLWLLRRLRQQLPTPSPTPAEESIPLRILVQLLVAVGIFATDLAADTFHSAWAIPISCIGAAWSWRQRHQRNITVKFLIAIGMLVALAAFFGNLLGSLNDTRLVLAELLIQLQVLHSFDLPRRKDLGYSMVIGLILLGVAGTLSQTLAFAPLLMLFLLIGLPVLVFDYRSRLGLEMSPASKTIHRSGKWQLLPTSTLSLPRLSVFFLLIVAVGLVIFALMPRLPSYQVQQFPVSGADILEDQGFDDNQNPRISNPGYVNEGQGEGQGQEQGDGTGTGSGQGQGEVDEQFYYGFQEQMNQNLGGEMKPRVVMRLRSQAPGWIKMMAFDHYTGQGWKIEQDEPTQELNRPSWSYRFGLSSSSTQAETERIVQTYTIVSELPNLIPTLPQAKEVYFPTEEIAVDPHGTIKSPVELSEGITFTVISRVPYRDRSKLRTASTDYPDFVRDHYLQVPPEIEDRIRNKTESILAESKKPLESSYEQALYLGQQIKQRYQVQANRVEPDQDLVETFLFDWEGGYPDHFSTTLTMMLRSIGIPARLATGFSSGELNPFTGLYVIKNTDAFALTEVYFPEYGWFPFDPIPGHSLIPQSIEKSQTFGVLRQFWNWIAGWIPSPVMSLFDYLWTVVIGTFIEALKAIWRFFTQGWLSALAGLISLVLASFLGWIGWQQLQRWRYQRWLSRLAPTERIYQQMLQLLAQQGIGKQPAQTPLEYVETTATRLEPPQVDVIQEISQAYVRWRYGNYVPHVDYLQQVLQQLKRSFQRKQR